MLKTRPRGVSALLPLAAICWLMSACYREAALVIRTPGDAVKARIGVLTGSTGEHIAKTRFPEADVQTFDDIMNAISAIQAKKLDAVITSLPTAVQVTKKNAGLYV